MGTLMVPSIFIVPLSAGQDHSHGQRAPDSRHAYTLTESDSTTHQLTKSTWHNPF